MRIKQDEVLPTSCMLGEYNGECALIRPTIFIDLHNLLFSLKDRLLQAKSVMHKHQKDIRGFFSNNDLTILRNIYQNEKLPCPQFVRDLIEKNHLTYKNQPSKNIDDLISGAFLERYDRPTQKSITKWMAFSKDKEKNIEIIDTIKSNRLYSCFPARFNDIFDAQLRCSRDIIEELAEEHIIINSPNTNQDEVMRFKSKCIEYYQSVFNSATIACFSQNDPISVTSHNMWGLYGDIGKGFALQYDLGTLDNFLITQNNQMEEFLLSRGRSKIFSGSKNAFNYCRIFPVRYQETSPFKFFRSYLAAKRNLISSDKEHLSSLLDEFFMTKNLHWQYESEVRMVFHYFSISALLDEPSHILNMSMYMRNPNAAEALVEQQQIFYNEKKNIVPFIKPYKIVLGWDYERPEYADLYKELIIFAKENKIEIGKLDKTVDYKNNQFVYSRIG